MRVDSSGLLRIVAVAFISSLALSLHAQSVVQSTSFQNGVDGYQGTFDMFISSNEANEELGANVANYFVDGSNFGGSPDTQGLFRFDDIFGDGAGQIPTGATILDAHLTLVNSVRNNAETNGPFGVSALLEPVSEDTTYLDYIANEDAEIDRGPWWQDGTATRPLAGFGFQLPGETTSADITPFVQQWSNGGLENHGITIQAGVNSDSSSTANTTNGWAWRTTGFPAPADRPMLEVTYTTASTVMRTFQDGTADYDGTTMAIVRSGPNALLDDSDDPLDPEITDDGFDLEQTFLDGLRFETPDGTVNSPDEFALLKFDGVFGNDEMQAPADIPIAKAWAVLTTGDTSTNAITEGPWSAHAMLRPWDTESLHSSFGDVNGLQVDDADIGAALDSLEGFVVGSEVWFDVTDYLEGVRGGAEDNGIAILTTGTDDGWQIHTHGSLEETARPRLVVMSADLGGGSQIVADCSGDGVVDAADLACVHTTNDPLGNRNAVLNALGTLPGDLDGDGEVAFADFLVLSGNFGLDNETAPAYTSGNIDMVEGVQFADFLILSGNFGETIGETASVPEPSARLLSIGGLLVVGILRRRKA